MRAEPTNPANFKRVCANTAWRADLTKAQPTHTQKKNTQGHFWSACPSNDPNQTRVKSLFRCEVAFGDSDVFTFICSTRALCLVVGQSISLNVFSHSLSLSLFLCLSLSLSLYPPLFYSPSLYSIFLYLCGASLSLSHCSPLTFHLIFPLLSLTFLCVYVLVCFPHYFCPVIFCSLFLSISCFFCVLPISFDPLHLSSRALHCSLAHLPREYCFQVSGRLFPRLSVSLPPPRSKQKQNTQKSYMVKLSLTCFGNSQSNLTISE